MFLYVLMEIYGWDTGPKTSRTVPIRFMVLVTTAEPIAGIF